ncbi:DUF3772 domain-containing protein [Novosphingobium sp. FGD1]|uniref:DUF3772 domain-containing protein n=1 Tax=Novosphingobium silvae TaxID=2692619 RepID=A0A7X4K8R0_9SPHN|nr:DUF3772 domain-containing protein [Novosphingobium silvae]MYL98573.1 DUF3772 domain-containing protein [Novosphingobium silvae]
MPFFLRILLSIALFTVSLPAWAQQTTPADLTRQIAEAEEALRSVDSALDGAADAKDRAELRTKALTAQQSVRSSEAQLTDQLALVDARIAGLGPVAEGTSEAPDIQRQRQRLGRDRTRLDAAIKRSRLAEVEAQQLVDEIDRSQAEQLNQTLSTRVHSPLAPAFWSALFASMPRDLRRIDVFVTQGFAQIRQQWHGGLPWQALAGVALAFALLFPLRVTGRRLGQRYLIGTAPGHRVRRSVYAVWRVLVGTVCPLLAAFALVQGFRWAGLFPARWDELLDGFIAASTFTAFIGALAGALLMLRQPSWRIAPLTDETVRRLHPMILLLAGISFASILLDSFNAAVRASRTAIAAWQMIEAMVHLVWVGAFLLLLARLRASHAAREDDQKPAAGAGIALATLVTWVLVIAALVALAVGYVGLSLFVARLMIWVTILGAALYLLLGTADDVATTLFNRDSPLGETLTRSVGLRPSLIDQFGVLVSGALRIMLVLAALGLLMTPFGGNGGFGTLFGSLGTFARGIEIGGVSISPGAIIRALVVLAIGLSLVRAFSGWLERRYLPVTDLDGSARNSAGLVARYVGIALAIIWTLASLGIGVEKIALLLSALSVGIGFGLQAITQNFVSGLILLAERPIKIGDWVRVGTDEGDVKRISVRSTEITLADHSTLIVPNSELITKSVLNKTLSSPLGRIQIQFSVLLGTEVDKVLGIVLSAFAEETAVLDDPAPSAFVDSIADGRILFNCFAHVGSPRDVYGARSRVFLTLLRQFAANDIDIGTVPQKLELLADHALPAVMPRQKNEDPGEPSPSQP